MKPDSDHGTPVRDPESSGDDFRKDLLPGSSSLVILLVIFGVLSLITVLTILRSGTSASMETTGADRAYSPADVSDQVNFNIELLDEVRNAPAGEDSPSFIVPPPPFSDEDIFPCSQCHEELELNLEPRTLEWAHEEIQLKHGPKDRWCFDCHNPDDRDYLRLVNGKLIPFKESYRLCGQCHGTIYRDWKHGIHGRRRGFWNGAKSYLQCPSCHNPHSPHFKPIKPLPPPVQPRFLRQEKREEKSHES